MPLNQVLQIGIDGEFIASLKGKAAIKF